MSFFVERLSIEYAPDHLLPKVAPEENA